MQETYDKIAAIITEHSDEHLDESYKKVSLHVLEKLCRKRPSPLLSGRANTWAAGIVYAVGEANAIFEKSAKIHMTASELAKSFGLSKSTVAQKASDIRKMLKISYGNAEWLTPERIELDPFVWMVEVDGIPVDA